MDEKKILIINYLFPPSPGIGGRRWAKFGKYLKIKGIEVYVLTSRLKGNFHSPWDRDVADIPVKYFNSLYPDVLNYIPRDFFEKIKYRISELFLRIISNGSIFDKAGRDRREILDKASRIINEKEINNLIVSGAPFSILFYGTLLKKKFPHINLITDLRDPWTWGLGYGFNNMSIKRRNYEEELEKMVLSFSNSIFVPVSPMQEFLQSKYPIYSNKIKLLPHGIDEDDFKNITFKNKKYSAIKFIYGGTIYDDLDIIFNKIISVVKKNLNADFEIHFYSPGNKYLKIIKDAGVENKIKNHGLVDSSELFNEIANSDYYLLIFPKIEKDFISTKFYEIIYLKKPIIYIGDKGEVSRFITENKLGVWIPPDEIEKLFDLALNGKILVEPYSFSSIEDYTFNNLTMNILCPLLENKSGRD